MRSPDQLIRKRCMPALAAAPVSLLSASSLTIDGLIKKITDQILKPVIGLLFVLATIVFMWGVIQYIISGAADKTEKAKSVIMWGLIGMAVMVGAWGFAKIICNFFVSTACNAASTLPL